MIMKRIKLFFILFFILIFFSVNVGAESPILKFKAGKFKILQFTDLHWNKGQTYEKANDSTVVLMKKLIEMEHPDLVVITGDIVVSWGAMDGWKQITKPMIDAKTPFVVTFGNHDVETDIPTTQALEILKRMPYNITYNADDNISGIGNCAFSIKSSNEKQDKWVLYFLDSHSYPTDKSFGSYDWIKDCQIQWYKKQSDYFTTKNGHILPSLAFFHIPLPEYEQKFFPAIGNKMEPVCSPILNSGLFAAFLDKKDVLGTFVGHDHNDDYLVDIGGKICLAYGRKTGYVSAYHEVLERGARVIELREDEKSFDTYIRTPLETSQNYTFEQKGEGGRPYPIAEGTFIQDFLVANWDDAQWQKELISLKEVGIHYLIFGPAFFADKNGRAWTLYPSSLAKNKFSKDLIEICLRNAKKYGFKVFLGLNFHENWWSFNFTPEWLYQQMELGNRVADELITRYKNNYGDTMYGWYWVWEVDNYHSNVKAHQDILINALNINLDHLNKVTPDMPFMLSPFMNYQVSTSDECGKLWEYVFAGTHFKNGDIFSPQDCVGAGGLDVSKLSEWFGRLQKAVNTKPELKFWANVETFDHHFWTSASLGRFVKQMNAVNPYTNKIITFAYSHYYSPLQKSKTFQEAYSHYYKNGKLPFVTPPDVVSNLIFEMRKGQPTVLKWDAPKDASTLVGYNIFKDGKQIGNIQVKPNDTCETRFVDKTSVTGVYEVSSYNCIGNESAKVKAVKNKK